MVQMKNIMAICGAGVLLFLSSCKNEAEAGAALYERYQEALLAGDATAGEQAAEYLQQAAESGYAPAMCRLGQRLMATGKAEDTAAGFAWLQRAADAADAEGLYLLGLCYDQGRGTEKNFDRASECWQKSAALNHAPALVTLGMAYANGYGGLEKNMEKAVENYGQAALLEDARGYYCMAVCYDQGKGVAKDASKAVAYARRAAEQQYTDACLFMGKAHLLGYGGAEKSPALAAPFLLKAADAGNAEAALRLGKLAFDGMGIKKDYALAVRCFQLAAQSGNSEAFCLLGACFDAGLGVQKNPAKAVECWKRSADGENARAAYFLGRCVELGHGARKDAALAARLYAVAARKGDDLGSLAYADCLLKGAGVQMNEAEAVRIYERLAQAGVPQAMLLLGICLDEGRGVNKDSAKARDWWRQAAAAGNEEAAGRLKP